MIAIFKREMRSYFHNVIGFVFLALLLLAAGGFCAVFNVLLGSPNFEDSLYYLQLALIVLVPLLTMRAMTEERRTHTDQLLYSLPVPLCKIVLGKYLAMVAMMALGCVVIALFPLILTMFGMSGLGAAYAMLLAFFLLSAALIAFCMFLSSLTENQLIAMILCVVGVLVLFLLDTYVTVFMAAGAVVSFIALIVLALLAALGVYGLTKNLYFSLLVAILGTLPQIVIFLIDSSLYDGMLYRTVSVLSLFYRYTVFGSGIFDLTTIVYDVSFAALFIFLTWLVMDKRRRA